MKRKPIKIDWDDVEAAFTESNHEVAAFLDLITGHVVLEGEGEEREDDFDAPLPPRNPVTRDDPTRLRVPRPDTALKIEWMRAFLDESSDLPVEVSERLRNALDAEDPAEEVSAVLRDNPEQRERWFLYRSDRVHALIRDWLASNGVELADDPPWEG